jgi:lysophospholipase L1-like esterase
MRRRLLALLVVPLVFLGLLEAGLRLAGLGPRAAQEGMLRIFRKSAIPGVLWEYVPGYRGRTLEGEVTINDYGLRDRPLSPTPPPGVTRLLCLGDSVTYGYRLPLELTWVKLLEKRANGDAPPLRPGGIECVNAGVSGYSTFQELAWLRHRGLALSPHVVLLGFVLNDITERYSEIAAYGGVSSIFGIDMTDQLGLLRRLWRRSAITELFLRGARWADARREEYNVARLFERRWDPKIQAAVATVEEELRTFHRLCQEAGVPCLLIIFPYAAQIDHPELGDRIQQHLLASAAEHDLPALDLLPIFRQVAAEQDQPLFMDANHPTPLGNMVAAEAILSRLTAAGLVHPAGAEGTRQR